MDPSTALSFSTLLSTGITVLLSAYPIWLPILLFVIFLEFWLKYVRTQNINKQGSVVLEVKLPRDITKSPLAMEIILAALWQKSSPTIHDTFLNGKIRPWFSFEMATIDGTIHFYIWTAPKYRVLIESNIYAQYPGIEISEVEDYTKWAHHDPVNLPMWSCYYKLSKRPSIPIRSYVDYGLDKASEKEEFKHDPLAATLEWMGSFQKGEQAWFQFMFQAHRPSGFLDGVFRPIGDWKKGAKDSIKKIIKDSPLQTDDDSKIAALPKTQAELIAAIQRNISKYAFDVCIRGVYIATKEANKISERASGMIGAFRQFSSQEHYNEIRLGKITDFDYPWEDFMRIRRNNRERNMLDAYKQRSFFQYPYKNYLQPELVMNTETLATLYHFPGAVVTTPSLPRIESKKSDAPPNLPV